MPGLQGGQEYQYEWNPGSQQAGEHLQAAVDQQGNYEEVHPDQEGGENDRRHQRGCVIEPAKVHQRHQSWELYKEIRLRLLEDPQDFGRTHEEENAFPQEKRLQRTSNPKECTS